MQDEDSTDEVRPRVPDEWLSVGEAADRLGASRPYVTMLCGNGRLGEVRVELDGTRTVRLSAVDAYRESQVLAPIQN
jgi:excisionase family DNA binding protein